MARDMVQNEKHQVAEITKDIFDNYVAPQRQELQKLSTKMKSDEQKDKEEAQYSLKRGEEMAEEIEDLSAKTEGKINELKETEEDIENDKLGKLRLSTAKAEQTAEQTLEAKVATLDSMEKAELQAMDEKLELGSQNLVSSTQTKVDA